VPIGQGTIGTLGGMPLTWGQARLDSTTVEGSQSETSYCYLIRYLPNQQRLPRAIL